MIVVLGVPPLLATLVGYFTQAVLFNEYLALFLALISLGLLFVIINFHGRALGNARSRSSEAVREPSDE